MISRPLLTAFEPFGDHGANTSLEVLTYVSGLTQMRRLVLPVLYGEAPDRVVRAAEAERPREIIMLGMAAGRSAVAIEALACNEITSSAADNGGVCLVGDRVRPTGPATLTTPYPREALRHFLAGENIAVELSDDAGGYVCNATFYGVAHWLWRRGLAIPATFIHIPGPAEWDQTRVELFGTALAEWLRRGSHR